MIGLYFSIGFTVAKLVQQMENLLNKYNQARLHLCEYLLNTCKY